MSDPTEPTRPSDSELELLQLLWDNAPQSAADLADKVRPARDWSLNTVKTLLSRMAAKALVSVEVEGRRHLYRPLVERDALARPAALGLFDRLFEGKLSPLVAQLADARDLDPADLAELEALVRKLRQ
jgi:predicted transcriptional regulator